MQNYDCSITKRKGCNYCLKSKNIPSNFNVYINDEQKEMFMHLIDLEGDDLLGSMPINYCPICGKEL